MPIPKQKYIQLKAMYDFQRKVEYNKEKLRKAVEVMLDEPDILFNDIWSRMKEDEMIEVTPANLRLRKKFLCPNERKRSSKVS